jgi:hypothetical protein
MVHIHSHSISNSQAKKQFDHLGQNLDSELRPVWFFSMDSDHFWAAPTITAGLKAYYQAYGEQTALTDIMLHHFSDHEQVAAWQQYWLEYGLPRAQKALQKGLTPLAGFSFYTWNAADFLALLTFMKNSCPELTIIAGGPHVQQVEDYLLIDPIDVIILGEGEITLTELLDASSPAEWKDIAGLAFIEEGAQGKCIVKTASRPRIQQLDSIPSALDIIDLCDSEGHPLYDSISYETSRGCPFKCAFCEWGTGAIGTKMNQFSMDRISLDWHKIIASGIKNIWLADSNFGALKEDLAKTRLICELKEKTGLPSTFATSWSKKHSPKVQEIVLLLNHHGLLPHYQLALQTLTPLALELSNRKNMEANKYQPIAKAMAEEGVPIAAELIWGLPGDNLHDFEQNLNTLIATFPNINIFGYTLLPGTEFYDRRKEYQIDAIPVAGYGKAKGEYVVGCHTYSREEGFEGYFMITAHKILVHGHIMPLLTRFLALKNITTVATLLRTILHTLIEAYRSDIDQVDLQSRMDIYEHRDLIYLEIMKDLNRTFCIIKHCLTQQLSEYKLDQQTLKQIDNILELDQCYAPRYGSSQHINYDFAFNATKVTSSLEAMDIPESTDFDLTESQRTRVFHPGGLGELLKDPDGGSWMKSYIDDVPSKDDTSDKADKKTRPNTDLDGPQKLATELIFSSN